MLRKIFYTGSHSIWENLALLILRLVAGSFMLTHGWGKIVKLLEGPLYEFSNPIGLGASLSLILVAFAEGICAVCVALGIAVRLTTIPIMITMAVAAFVAHANDAFFAKEMPLMYFTMFLVIAIIGAGKFSIDRLLESRKL
ncbi:MAG TPA: DoxX family protein [Lentimicrobium sp.]|nr:DoxX family protein [Lentimicrobium sp.]